MKRPENFAGIFIHRDPLHMRKQINGLAAIVQSAGMGDLMGPHLFVLAGLRYESIKVIYFDKSGFALWQKKLEKAKFPWPRGHAEETITLTPEQFTWLLDGYNVWKMKPFEKLHFERVY